MVKIPEDIVSAKINIDVNNGRGGQSSSGANVGKMLGIPGIGKIAAGVGLAVAALGAIKKGIDKVVQSSPRLQAQLNILGKTFSLLLRPIGDILATIIRPFALAWIKFAIPFYRDWRDAFGKWFDSDKGIGETLDTATSTTAQLDFFDSLREKIEENREQFEPFINILEAGVNILESLAGVFNFLWGIIKILAAIVVVIANLFIWLYDTALKPLQPILEVVSGLLVAIGEFFSDIGTALFDLATSGDWDAFTENIRAAWQEMTAGIVKVITERVIEPVSEAWLRFSTWFDDKIIQPIRDLWQSFADWFDGSIIQPIKNAWDNAINAIKDFFSNIGQYLPFFSGTNVKDAIITPSGIVNTAPDDYIIATKNPGALGGGGGNSITININALDASSIDTTVLTKITNAVSESMKRGLSRRTMESSGVFNI